MKKKFRWLRLSIFILFFSLAIDFYFSFQKKFLKCQKSEKSFFKISPSLNENFQTELNQPKENFSWDALKNKFPLSKFSENLLSENFSNPSGSPQKIVVATSLFKLWSNEPNEEGIRMASALFSTLKKEPLRKDWKLWIAKTPEDIPSFAEKEKEVQSIIYLDSLNYFHTHKGTQYFDTMLSFQYPSTAKFIGVLSNSAGKNFNDVVSTLLVKFTDHPYQCFKPLWNQAAIRVPASFENYKKPIVVLSDLKGMRKPGGKSLDLNKKLELLQGLRKLIIGVDGSD